MTDFQSFDPNKQIGLNFNSNRQARKEEKEQAQEAAPAAPKEDPYAGQKMDADRIFELMANQAKQNVPVENPAISRHVAAFSGTISPERHERLTRIFENAFRAEFGRTPDEETLQNLVDDFIIGRPDFAQA